MFFKKLPVAKALIFAVCGLLTTIAVQHPASAQVATACDPEYMDALEARAYLEAQREITQNQNLILKPDSVFEYTCFDQVLFELANRGGTSSTNFSESTLWGAIIGQGPASLDLALGTITAMSLSWVTANYTNNASSDSYLAQRGAAKRAYGVNAAFGCAEMAKVWTGAQCMDFFNDIASPGRDGFYDFFWYTAFEPRRGLNGNACPTPPGFSVTEMQVAFNNQAPLYSLLPENPWPGDLTLYVDDPVVTYLNLIQPGTCAPPILTGVMVDRMNVAAYPDAVCPNPGCHYTGPTGTCVP